MKILVTGGAGYIGSFMVRRLLDEGYEVVVLDSLKRGYKEAVDERARLLIGNLCDHDFMEKLSRTAKLDGVIHFAAYALADESMRKSFEYFHNNVLGGLNLLEFMRKSGTSYIIFSSTCAIYGAPQTVPVNENAEKKPESIYGESKLMFEKILCWYDKIYGLKHISLRYFNAAGAAFDGSLGENHEPETHIIPIAIKAALGQISKFPLYGNDYPTPDGTCIRDYIHVEDLVAAHLLALKKLLKTKTSESFNLGTGRGYSNLEVLAMVKKVSGVNFPIEVRPRRPGDPPIVFSDNKKAEQELGFIPRYSNLEVIVKTAWEWHKISSNLKSQNLNSK